MANIGQHAKPDGGLKLKKTEQKSVEGSHAAREKGVLPKLNFDLGFLKNRKTNVSASNVLRAVLFLLLCILMISPLKSCVLTDGDYIGANAAKQIALDDAGIMPDKASDVSADMVKIDDEYYYKVQFTGSVTDYRYIIDADSGEIIAQAFYHLDGEE